MNTQKITPASKLRRGFKHTIKALRNGRLPQYQAVGPHFTNLYLKGGDLWN
jgi:hypothetical protein